MKRKLRIYLLGIYDLILSFGAIYNGVKMIQSDSGIFTEYPKEWLTKVPFTSWVMPGIIAISIYGLGNIIAAIFSIIIVKNKPWLVSLIMGGIFFISLIAQVILLDEIYLATAQFFVYSIVQITLSGYVYMGYSHNKYSLQGE
jgi:hypothetical protein